MEYINCNENSLFFSMQGCAPGIVLITRHKATQEWPIVLLHFIYNFEQYQVTLEIMIT